jgi:hypothetical protein
MSLPSPQGRSTVSRGAVRLVLMSAVALAAVSCSAVDTPSSAEAATVTVAITQAPSDAGCLRIGLAASQNIVRTMGLTPGQSTVFLMTNLPTGGAIFTAEAFELSCATADFSAPSYVSDPVPMTLKAGQNGTVTLLMRRNARINVAVDFPGDERGSWVSETNAPPGTPATIVFDPVASSLSQSSFNVTIAGFFVQERLGPDGVRYLELTVPGLGSRGLPGAPRLPMLRAELAVANDAKAFEASARYLDTVEMADVLPWPEPEPGLDHEEGTPDRFVRNEKIYGGQVVYPGLGAAALQPVSSKMGSILGAAVQMNLAQWDPATRRLTLATRAIFEFAHPGIAIETGAITLERNLAASVRFANWEVIGKVIRPELRFYTGDFLFIYPPAYADEVLPLVNQKKARGFAVTELTTAQTGNTCASIRAAIAAWYTAAPSWRDKFAILVGDVDQIPLCTAPTGVPTDDLYASVGGDDLDEEIYVGRLSVNSETDCTTQVSKILAYSNTPDLFFNYGTALLVAHREGAPGKYVGAHESVRTAIYSVPPAFTTLYGHVAGNTDSDISDAINNGMGLVAYRGHGNETAWTGWSLLNEYYDPADLSTLFNPGAHAPVIWSFACTNSDLGSSDSVGERWLQTEARAVSHYGATVPSYTHQNHELDRQMFKAVYDASLTAQGRAIEYGEAQMGTLSGGSENAWMYLLLGDPEMRIRRGRILNFSVLMPQVVSTCPNGGCQLQVKVQNAQGLPLAGVLVSAFKQGGTRGDDVFDNRYTDAEGVALVPASPATPGTLQVTFRDLAGNDAQGTIEVR